MKKLVVLVSALLVALALSACATGSFDVSADDAGIHARAAGGVDGSGAGKVSVVAGRGLRIAHAVNGGSFHVKAVDEVGRIAFDRDVTGEGVELVDSRGEFDVEISAYKADGTVDISSYDKTA